MIRYGAEVLAEGGEAGVEVVGAPEQRVRVDRGRAVQGDEPQIVVGGPDEGGLFAEKGGEGRGVGDGVEQRLDAEVRADRVDGEPEGGAERVVVGGPFGAGGVAGHPDPVPGELGRVDRGRGGVRVGGPGEEPERLVEGRGGLDVVGEPTPGRGHGAEGGVDRAGADGGDGLVDVVEGHDVEFDVGVCAVEVAQQAGDGAPAADDVDAEGAVAGPYGRGGPLGGPQEGTGVRQERLPVDGEPGSTRGAGEEPHAQVLLQRGDALGDGLLGDGQIGGGVLEPSGVRDGDEGAYGGDFHGRQL